VLPTLTGMTADGSSRSDAQSQPARTAMRKVAELGDGAWLRQRYLVEGASISAIAAELGCAIASVRSALAAEAISVRASGPQRKLSGLQPEEAVRLVRPARDRRGSEEPEGD
jgi:hypothetical protein